jgi:hypothetical protein
MTNDSCYQLNEIIDKYINSLEPLKSKYNYYFGLSAEIINKVNNREMLSNAMKAYIIGTKASRKPTYFGKPFLKLECCSD